MKRLAALSLLLFACEDRVILHPDCRGFELERAEWVLECIAAGNPYSDEEGEDLVAQCEKSSTAACPIVRWAANHQRIPRFPCDAEGVDNDVCKETGQETE